jgi:hypothetical protein
LLSCFFGGVDEELPGSGQKYIALILTVFKYTGYATIVQITIAALSKWEPCPRTYSQSEFITENGSNGNRISYHGAIMVIHCGKYKESVYLGLFKICSEID